MRVEPPPSVAIADRPDAGGDRDRRAAARAAAGALGAPGVARAAEQRRVGQALWPNSGVVVLPNRMAPACFIRAVATASSSGTLSSCGQRAEGRAHARGVDQILGGVGNAVQQAERLARHDVVSACLRRGHRLIGAERDEAVQHRLQLLGARQHGRISSTGETSLRRSSRRVRRGQQAQVIAHRAQLPGSSQGEDDITRGLTSSALEQLGLAESPLPFTRKTMAGFVEATAVRNDGVHHQALIDPDWFIWGPFGGYLAALAMRAMAAQSAFGKPATFSCQYLNVGRPAPCASRSSSSSEAGPPNAFAQPFARTDALCSKRSHGSSPTSFRESSMTMAPRLAPAHPVT